MKTPRTDDPLEGGPFSPIYSISDIPTYAYLADMRDRAIAAEKKNEQIERELAEAREDAANQRRLAGMALAHRDMIIEERDTLVDAVDEFLSQIGSPLAPLRQALAAVKGGSHE